MKHSQGVRPSTRREYLAAIDGALRVIAKAGWAGVEMLEEQLGLYGITLESLDSDDLEILQRVYSDDERVRGKFFEAQALAAHALAEQKGWSSPTRGAELRTPTEPWLDRAMSWLLRAFQRPASIPLLVSFLPRTSQRLR
jgi:hypothetical protein